MKHLFQIVFALAVCAIPISCFVGAVILSLHDKQGWGWLIFAGIIIGGSLKMKFD